MQKRVEAFKFARVLPLKPGGVKAGYEAYAGAALNEGIP